MASARLTRWPPPMFITLPAGACGARTSAFDDVVDEGEVARLRAVAVHDDRAALEQRPDELVEGHVRALARAVHGEEAQRRRCRSPWLTV